MHSDFDICGHAGQWTDKSLMLIIIIFTKTARKIFSILKSLSGLARPLVASCWPPCASLVSWAASAELEPGAGSGVSNESRYVDNYNYYMYV